MLDDALVVPNFRLRDFVTRHAQGPQDESDDENEDENEDTTDGDSSESAIIAAARRRWTPPPPPPPPPPPAPTMPSASSTTPLTSTEQVEARRLHKKEKKSRLHRKSRNVKRETLREAAGGSKTPKAVVLKHIRQTSPIPLEFRINSDSMPVASSGWMGLRDPEPQGFIPEDREYSFEEARAIPGMHVLDTNGKPGPLVDADRYVIGAFAATPRDKDWDSEVAGPAAALMQEASDSIYGHVFSGVYYGTRKEEKKRRQNGGKPTPLDQKIPRRGPHRAKTFGNSMGGGQETPTPFFHTLLTRIVLAGLLATEPFQRIAGFTNGMFRAYAPDVHDYYEHTLTRLHRWNRRLVRNFKPALSVFAAATFNFGPATVTLPHLDFANLAWGWCAITALGHFDPDKGGHLILWDLMLIIRFPPGSTLLIPSALLRHSNTSIQPGETRFSFTQFTAAGIFRFVDNDFHTDRSVVEAGLTAAEKTARLEARKTRWLEGLKMYKRWDVAFEGVNDTTMDIEN
ncbi:hypothetical protein B0H13DRAFT_2305803 [Mycena leptocephala]|nr:hypothetical protein B0H13DRAFT_2375772 [Mycena leptocephala]KAJ7934385.1 hypothetical protein B0H13DRAFT_2305803 [Mycena leptocephala]